MSSNLQFQRTPAGAAEHQLGAHMDEQQQFKQVLDAAFPEANNSFSAATLKRAG
jgi:hypothetical protein